MNFARSSTLAALGLLAACAGAQKTQATGEAARQQLKIMNISQFDIATCWPRPVELTTPVSRDALVGMLVSLRPEIYECLVDSKNRGPDKTTKVSVDMTLSETGVENKITGENLPPPGAACIKDVFDKAAALDLKPSAKGSAPVSAHGEFVHTQGSASTPSVIFGVNEGSDIVGTVRLAEKTWCECFADWKAAAPRQLSSKIVVDKGPAAADGTAGQPKVTVTFEPANDPTADKVAACLTPKMTALPFSINSAQVQVPYRFWTLNSAVSDDLPGAPEDVNIFQLDVARAQHMSDVAIKRASRISAMESYNDAVDKYKKTKDFALVKDLKLKCSALLRTDDAWSASMEKLLDLDKRALTLATGMSTKAPDDAKLKEVATESQKVVDGSTTDLEAIKKTRVADANGCPKERK